MTLKHPDYPFYCRTSSDLAKLNALSDHEVDPDQIKTQWNMLLENCGGEQEVQDFLENYPMLVPGLADLHHGPLGNIVASKFPFGADYVSDYAYVTANSAFVRITFVEIESPNKPIFTADDAFTQDFNKSVQQLRDWNQWCAENQTSLSNTWTEVIHECGYSQQHITTGYLLVIGRRRMAEQSSVRRRRWSNFIGEQEKNNFEIMTYDRLSDTMQNLPSRYFMNRLVVCSYGNQRFIAKSSLV